MNRILICGPRSFNKEGLIKAVLDESVSFKNTISKESQAGTILKDLELITKYYTASIGVFIDEPDINGAASYNIWIEELLSSEAKELRDTLQLLIFVFQNKQEYLQCNEQINRVSLLLESECLPFWDGEIAVLLADDLSLAEETDEDGLLLSLCQLRNMTRLVTWRQMKKVVGESLRVLDSRRGQGEEEEGGRIIVDLDTALARLKDAKNRNTGEITEADKTLIDTIVKSLLS